MIPTQGSKRTDFYRTFQIGFGAQRFRRTSGEVRQVLGPARVQARDRVHPEGAEQLRRRRQVPQGRAQGGEPACRGPGFPGRERPTKGLRFRLGLKKSGAKFKLLKNGAKLKLLKNGAKFKLNNWREI